MLIQYQLWFHYNALHTFGRLFVCGSLCGALHIKMQLNVVSFVRL